MQGHPITSKGPCYRTLSIYVISDGFTWFITNTFITLNITNDW